MQNKVMVWTGASRQPHMAAVGTAEMSTTTTVLLAVLALVLSCSCPCSAEQGQRPVTAPGKPDPVAAIERARQGDPDELFRITQMMAGHPQLLPVRKQLAQYHKYLQDTNVFVQCFAVQVLAGLKDKTSAEPLRQFIADTERRRNDHESPGKTNLGAPGQKEAVALSLACGTALMALGEIDEGSPMSVKVLASQLKHDIPMEWGGGVAHSALAKKGRAGLRALLDEAAQPMNDHQKMFLSAAINKIRDPALAVDLYACCRDQKYDQVARHAALWALRDMAGRSPAIEQMVINVAEDEKSDLRSSAIWHLGCIGTSHSRQKLLELEKTVPGETNAVQAALMECDATNRLPRAVEAFLAPNTPLDEKKRLWGLMEWKSTALLPYADRLLGVTDENGTPVNDLRYRVWQRLCEIAKKRYPLELDCSNEQRYDRVVQEIASSFERVLYFQDAGKWTYTDAQRKQMALDEAKALIKPWERRQTEESQQSAAPLPSAPRTGPSEGAR
jgi:HEAT repeat protein